MVPALHGVLVSRWGEIAAVLVGIAVFLAFCAFADSSSDKDHEDEDE